MLFSELNLSLEVSRAINELGFTEPSPIQVQTLPLLLGEPTDFIGLAATGTGKTAAFAIPLLEKIDPSIKQIQAIVLCPTRELALQVTGQINLLGKFKNIKALPVYGGSGFSEQIQGLKFGHQIVVGTPGRMVDHLERKTLNMQNVTAVVLDEADEMVSMGFREELEFILAGTDRSKCNTWLFSATMDKQVRKVADTYLTNPKFVQVNRTEVLSTTVEQIYYMSRESDKPEILCKLIEAAEDFYGVIFCQTKSLVMDLTHYLAGRGYKVDSLHGDKSQTERERTMQAFRDKKLSILVCTDVASRGLDVKDLTHVVNYSIPRELEIYVHRIGRTARSGKSGIAMSLVTPSHRHLIGKIEQITKSKMSEGRVPSRKDVGLKKVAKLLSTFSDQKNHGLASQLLSPEWMTAIKEMTSEEIVGRFLCILSPDIFENQERTKPLQAPVQTDAQGNALPGPRHFGQGDGSARRNRGGDDRRRSSEGRRDYRSRDDGAGRSESRDDRRERYRARPNESQERGASAETRSPRLDYRPAAPRSEVRTPRNETRTPRRDDRASSPRSEVRSTRGYEGRPPRRRDEGSSSSSAPRKPRETTRSAQSSRW